MDLVGGRLWVCWKEGTGAGCEEVEEVGAATLEMPAQELCNADLMFLAALTDLAAQGASDLESEIVCVTMGLGSTGVSNVDKLGCVGAGLGGGFDHMLEMHVMKFKQAMRLVEKDQWMKAVDE